MNQEQMLMLVFAFLLGLYFKQIMGSMVVEGLEQYDNEDDADFKKRQDKLAKCAKHEHWYTCEAGDFSDCQWNTGWGSAEGYCGCDPKDCGDGSNR